MQHQQQSLPRQSKPPRLKIILLGSAGAGKTSLLRRFVNGTFQYGGSQNGDTKQRNTMSTLGADYYVKRMEHPLSCYSGTDEVEPCHVLIQLWDTRGSESRPPISQRSCSHHKCMQQFNMYQFLSLDKQCEHTTLFHSKQPDRNWHRYNNWGLMERHQDINTQERNNRISTFTIQDAVSKKQDSSTVSKNALLDHVDACMLVYDATSSTSFLRLMQFHEEWMQRRKKRLPFIVVANKIDLLDHNNKTAKYVAKANLKSRSVMGLRGNYRGLDEKYEYAADYAPKHMTSPQCNTLDCHYKKQDNNSSKYERRIHKDNKLTYSLKETCWSSDEQYLHCLQQADDQLPSNRTMVLLWCKRNGIPHVEASALDGRGVDFAMRELIRLGFEERLNSEEERIHNESNHDLQWEKFSVADDDNVKIAEEDDEMVEFIGDISTTSAVYDDNVANGNGHNQSNQEKVDTSQNTFLYVPKYDKKLDLFTRYSRKEDKRCTLNCLRC